MEKKMKYCDCACKKKEIIKFDEKNDNDYYSRCMICRITTYIIIIFTIIIIKFFITK